MEEKPISKNENILEVKKAKTRKKPTTRRKSTKKGNSKRKITKPKRPYPQISLEKALQIAQKIKDLNGGNPWSPEDIAKSLEIGAKTTPFYYFTAASRDFGLTIGSSKTKKIELAKLGKEILYASNSEMESKYKVEAFLKIPIFKQVLNYYNGGQLPEMKYLGNTLQKEFNLHPDYHEDFSKVFKKNCEFLKINSPKKISNLILP